MWHALVFSRVELSLVPRLFSLLAGVGLKRGMGNEEMGNGNEEMEMWKYRSSIIQMSRNAPPSL